MTIPFIDLKTQYQALKPQIQARIDAVLEHGQYIMGLEVKELEEKLAAFTGAKHCITCASGTEALLMSLMALGVGPGDEIVTTPFTFVATAEVIVLLGAMPVIEDAAQSFGATYKGRMSCNLSTIGCTSFFPSKPLGCYGDGGAIFTNDDNLAQAMREIRVHGQSQRYVHTRLGVGGRMDTIQCAIVLAKLERFNWELQQRQKIGQRYNQLLDEAGIARIQQRPQRTSAYAQYTIVVPQREALQKLLARAGIPTAVHYPVPLNEQPAYKHLCCPDCTPVAKQLAKRVMSLPMHPELEEEMQSNIVNSLIVM